MHHGGEATGTTGTGLGTRGTGRSHARQWAVYRGSREPRNDLPTQTALKTDPPVTRHHRLGELAGQAPRLSAPSAIPTQVSGCMMAHMSYSATHGGWPVQISSTRPYTGGEGLGVLGVPNTPTACGNLGRKKWTEDSGHKAGALDGLGADTVRVSHRARGPPPRQDATTFSFRYGHAEYHTLTLYELPAAIRPYEMSTAPCPTVLRIPSPPKALGWCLSRPTQNVSVPVTWIWTTCR